MFPVIGQPWWAARASASSALQNSTSIPVQVTWQPGHLGHRDRVHRQARAVEAGPADGVRQRVDGQVAVDEHHRGGPRRHPATPRRGRRAPDRRARPWPRRPRPGRRRGPAAPRTGRSHPTTPSRPGSRRRRGRPGAPSTPAPSRRRRPARRSLTGVSSRARVSATLRATPPKEVTARAGFEVAATTGSASLSLRSTTQPPAQTTRPAVRPPRPSPRRLRAQASITTGMIIGRRRWLSATHLPTVRRTSCCRA